MILPVLGVLITRSMVHPILIDDLAAKAKIDELTSGNLKIAEFFAK